MKILVLPLLLPGLLAAQFTLEQVLSAPFPSELAAAPQGQRVAWIADARGRRNVRVAEGPQFQARQLTSYSEDDGQEIGDLAFTPDGAWVIFVRGGPPNQAGEIPNPTSDPAGVKRAVFAASWKDGRVRLLAEGESPVVSPSGEQVVYNKGRELWICPLAERSEPRQLFSARGNNGSAVWSPDGRRLAFVSARGDHSLIGVYDLTAKTLRYASPSVDRDSHPRWSPDGGRIAFVRQPARGPQARSLGEDSAQPWSILVADAATLRAREVWRSEATRLASFSGLLGDSVLQWGAGDRLIFASERDGWMHLYAVPAGGGGAALLLTPGECEVEDVTMTRNRAALFYSSNCGDIDRRHLWRVSVDGGAPVAVTSGEGIEWNPAVTADGAFLVHLASDARTPATPRVLPLAGGGAARALGASALPEDFPSAQLVTPQPVLFRSADGMEIHGQLFLPAERPAGARLPAVIFMHGGPVRQMLLGWHYRYYYHNAYAFNQYLASRGFAVLSVNFRSGIGYGRAFREAPKRGARGASEYQDIVAGAEYLRSRPDIDPARIGLWGGSYGGYLTALGLARNSDLFAAGVDLHGVHDWSVRISNAPWIDYSNQGAQKVARESSPVSAVASWRSPVLLIHGDDDRNVAFSQTVDLVRRLREQKVEFEQLVFPDEVHDFLLHRHWLEAYAAAADFFERRLKGR